MTQRIIDIAREQYGIDSWSNGYFSIGNDGHIKCHPFGPNGSQIDLHDSVEKAKASGVNLPVIMRFPQIITSQIERLNSAFQDAIWEYSYKGRHQGVFPFKVNQRREFIDNIVKCGRDLKYGLEVGSKTEFIAALSYELADDALLICNGFKDQEFIDLGFAAAAMNKNVVLVIEGPDELRMIMDKAKTVPYCPEIGTRVKLYSRGSGKWAKSSGESSKFGLSTLELLECLHLIEQSDIAHKFSMLHFHIGSQITEIKRVKNAIKEAARVFSKVCQMGFSVTKLNIGGGIGVDYDGSKTSFSSSANYSLQEFANDVVYEIGEVCTDEEIQAPDIITESGRVIAAYHSVVVTDIREIQSAEIQAPVESLELKSTGYNEPHKNTAELKYILDHMNSKNYAGQYIV